MSSPASRPFLLHCGIGASSACLDVLLKNAVIVYVAFSAQVDATDLARFSALVWILFMAPFVLFSAHGGYLGDHVDRRALQLALRSADLGIAALAFYGFATGHVPLLLGLVFAKGVTATLYSPIKYALVADLLPPPSHPLGYALVEAATMAAILCGTYLGALLGADADPGRIGMLAMAIAALACLLVLAGPSLPAAQGTQPALGLDPVRPTLRILRLAIRDRRIAAALLGVGWYWALGAVYLSNVAGLVRDVLRGDEFEIAKILVVFMLGAGLGMVIGTLGKRGRSMRLIPHAMATLMALAGADLLISLPASPLRMLLDFFAVAAASGVYATYFSSLLYDVAGSGETSRVFAAGNIFSSLMMVVALGCSTLIQQAGLPVALCLALFAMASVPVTLLVMSLLAQGKAIANAA